MDEQQALSARRNRGGGREAKRAARAARSAVTIPYITRALPYYEVLDEQALATIERNADTILEEIGIDFRDDAESLALWKAAGADVKGERVHFPRGLCRSLIRDSAPREFVQYARNPAHNVADRRQAHGVCPGLRLAVHPQPRRGPSLRAHRGFPEFRQARLHGALAASLGRHDLRAGRPAGQQAAFRHGLQPHQIQRQAVHGLGHAPRTRRRYGRDGEDRVRRRTSWTRPPGDREPCWSASSMPTRR